MFFFGFFLGSTYYFIAVTVTADLGRKNSKEATSTITGIVDGIGSTLNGIGQLVVGSMIDALGWRYGFLLPICISTGAMLIPLGIIFSNE